MKSNFAFLQDAFSVLANFGALAEQYYYIAEYMLILLSNTSAVFRLDTHTIQSFPSIRSNIFIGINAFTGFTSLTPTVMLPGA